METLDDARRLIDAAFGPFGATALHAALGFLQPPAELDRTALEHIGLASEMTRATITAGEGVLRALAFDVNEDRDLRECVTAVARRLAAVAPHLLWLLVAFDHSAGSITIAAWRAVPNAQRIGVLCIQRGRVVDSDAETLCALAAAATMQSDVMRHLRWLDILGRDSITHHFFRSLETAIGGLAQSLPASVPPLDAREMALLAVSRLVFLSFLETKGWLDRDFGFLENGFAMCMARGGSYHRTVLEPLFFGTLNTRVKKRAPRAREFGRVPFLNGGLFSRTPVERIHRHQRFSDDALGSLFGDLLVRYRFTAGEDAAAWSQTAIDPEILGRVFEAVMESGDRKRGGVFYTPRHFVERVTTLALRAAMERRSVNPAVTELLVAGEAPPVGDVQLLRTIEALRLLDPSCGSGAFLVHALERLSHLRTILGDPRPRSLVRRDVLTRCIFGVDSNPIAVWLCELRLWLSVVIDSGESDPMRVMPLPNLDRNIRVGDSLGGAAFDGVTARGQSSRQVSVLRDRYVRSTGRRKLSLARQLDAAERVRALSALDREIVSVRYKRREKLAMARARDLFNARSSTDPGLAARLHKLRSTLHALARRRKAILRGEAPSFSYPTHFADIADTGGFDLVLGNPPWVRVHNIPERDRAEYRERFDVIRAGAWREGAREAHVAAGFASQIDIAALFVERAIGLLATNGTFGFLLPSKLWRSLAGGGVRALMLERTHVHALEDHNDAPAAFDAAVYPSIVVASRKDEAVEGSASIHAGVQRGARFTSWRARPCTLVLDPSPGSPWVLLPPDCRAAFDMLSRHGVPLFASVLGRPRLGVKTGCNEAFLVNAGKTCDSFTEVTRGSRHGRIESSHLRTLVRGETLTRWRLGPNDERLVWTHATDGMPLRTLSDGVREWLAVSRSALGRRADVRSAAWWSLFRIECARCEFPRVVWADFGRVPRAAVIDARDPVVPLNTCYSIACADEDDALALAAILNSGIAAAWLGAIAEPARGGFRRFLAWTVSRLPIPADWPSARSLLAPIAREARDGRVPASGELNAAVLEAYGVPMESCAPLLDWTASAHD